MIRELTASGRLEPMRFADDEFPLIQIRKAKRVGEDSYMVVDGGALHEVVLDDVERDFEDRRTARHALILQKREKKVTA
jgi:hypothetical protein